MRQARTSLTLRAVRSSRAPATDDRQPDAGIVARAFGAAQRGEERGPCGLTPGASGKLRAECLGGHRGQSIPVDAPGDDLGDAVRGVQFALGGDGGQQPGGFPAVGFRVVEAADDRPPRGAGNEAGPHARAEDSGCGGVVPSLGVQVRGMQVTGHERGQRSGLFLCGGDRLGGGQDRAFGAQDAEENFASGVLAGVEADLVDTVVFVEG